MWKYKTYMDRGFDEPYEVHELRVALLGEQPQ